MVFTWAGKTSCPNWSVLCGQQLKHEAMAPETLKRL